MMRYVILLGVALLGSSQVWAAANCLHSNSWQCQQHHSASGQGSQTNGGLSSGGHTPDPATTNPHLGTTGGNNQNPVAVVPAQVVNPSIAVPPLAPTAVPPKQPTPLPQKQPIAVPGQVPQVVAVPSKPPVAVPPKQPIAVPGQVPQVVAVPSKPPVAVPPKQPVAVPGQVPQVVAVPSQKPVAVPPKQPVAVPGQVPQKYVEPPRQVVVTPHPSHVHFPHPTQVTTVPSVTGTTMAQVGPRPVQLTHKPNMGPVVPQVVGVVGKTKPTVQPGKQPAVGTTHFLLPTGERQVPFSTPGASIWVNEVVEPGIQNREVELYRSNDAEELLYKDVIPMDKTGFHLTVVGIRPPDYGVSQ